MNIAASTRPRSRSSAASPACWCSPRPSARCSSGAWRKGQPHSVIDNLNARVNAWWVMVAVIGLAFVFGKGGVIVLFSLISFYALREFMSLAYTRRGDHQAIALAFFVALPVQYFLIWIEWYGLYSIFIPVYAFLVLPILAAVGGDTKRFLERTSKVQWGLMVCVFCISHVPALLTLADPRLRGPQPAADRLPRDRRAGQRRAAVRVGQALRQAQGRARAVAVEDLGRPGRRRGQRHRARRRAVLGHAVQPVAGGADGARPSA